MMKNWLLNPNKLGLALTGSLFLLSSAVSSYAADASGIWKWTITTQNGDTIDSTLELKQTGETLTGMYKGSRGGESKIENGKISSNEVSFKVKREFQENSFTIVYKGKLEGDRIDGSISVEDRERTFEWHAKRETAAPNLTGESNWSVETQNGETFEAKLTLKSQGATLTGKLVGDGWEIEIQDGQTKGNSVSFTTKRETDDGRTITYKSEGTVNGGAIAGTVKFKGDDGEDRSLKWKARR